MNKWDSMAIQQNTGASAPVDWDEMARQQNSSNDWDAMAEQQKSLNTAATIMDELDKAHAVTQNISGVQSNNPYVQGMIDANTELKKDIATPEQNHNVIPVLYALVGTKDTAGKNNVLGYLSPYSDKDFLTPDDVSSIKEITNTAKLVSNIAAYSVGEGIATTAFEALAPTLEETAPIVPKLVRGATKKLVGNAAGSLAAQGTTEGKISPEELALDTVGGAASEGGLDWLLGEGKQGYHLLNDITEGKKQLDMPALDEAHKTTVWNGVKQYADTWQKLLNSGEYISVEPEDIYAELKKNAPDTFKKIKGREPTINRIKRVMESDEVSELSPNQLRKYANNKVKEYDVLLKPKAEERAEIESAAVIADANKMHREANGMMKGEMQMSNTEARSIPLSSILKAAGDSAGIPKFISDAFKPDNSKLISEELKKEGKNLVTSLNRQANKYKDMYNKLPEKGANPSSDAQRVLYDKIYKQAEADADLIKSINNGEDVEIKLSGRPSQREKNFANEELYETRSKPLTKDVRNFLSKIKAARAATAKAERPLLYKNFGEIYNAHNTGKLKTDGAIQAGADILSQWMKGKVGHFAKAAAGGALAATWAHAAVPAAGVMVAASAGKKATQAYESALMEEARQLSEQVITGEITEDQAKAIMLKKAKNIMAVANTARVSLGQGLKALVNGEDEEE
ncbi:hypothetical protein PYR66_09895 [Klebsiella aerogenes]|nr:hypothetical protein PYR66_09895 [Klebsiella aerogenes]